MTTKQELIERINSFPADAEFGIDEGGIELKAFSETGEELGYLEVGGIPDEEDENEPARDDVEDIWSKDAAAIYANKSEEELRNNPTRELYVVRNEANTQRLTISVDEAHEYGVELELDLFSNEVLPDFHFAVLLDMLEEDDQLENKP